MLKLQQSDTNPLRSKWPIIFGVLVILAFAGFLYFGDRTEITSKTTLGFVYGLLGFSAILFLAFLRVRKAMYRVKIGSLNAWVQSHVYIGILSLLLILLHTGLNFSGTFSTILFVLFALVVVSGIIGMIFYTIIPSSLTKFGREILPKEEILERLDEFQEQADKIAVDAGEVLAGIYKDRMRDYFLMRKTRWSYLLKEERQLLKGTKDLFKELGTEIPKESTYDLNMLSAIYVDAQRLHFKWAKVRAIRGWLNMHIPLTAMMLVAAVAHICSVIYY